MTALNAYIRLESTGLWRADPQAQRRDVYVFLGDASLVVADKSETALSHWSLPAIERLNPGDTPALFAPGPDAGETLEIDDDEMIAAIERVRAVVHARDPKPGRLRLYAGLTMLTGLLALAVLWLPGALVTHAERVVPDAKRADLGARALAFVEAVGGGACRTPTGAAELRRLARRLSPDAPLRIVVLEDWPRPTGHLTGGIILVDRLLIDAHDSPEVLAGHVIAERARAAQALPLQELLEDAGTVETMRFLATGELSDEALRRHADRLVTRPPIPLDVPDLVAAFEASRVPMTPYADSLTDASLSATLIQRDPFVVGAAPSIMQDNAWVALQSICDRG